jgi:hypothetical protein
MLDARAVDLPKPGTVADEIPNGHSRIEAEGLGQIANTSPDGSKGIVLRIVDTKEAQAPPCRLGRRGQRSQKCSLACPVGSEEPKDPLLQTEA